ncbi:hypothetical protein DL768_001438 [Monosporascus sp. mg162]|nr:hypothetical protein DL768_001438 [Monosporascus sp. mg162]
MGAVDFEESQDVKGKDSMSSVRNSGSDVSANHLLEVRGRQEALGGALQPLAARGPRLALPGRQALGLGGDGEQLV